MFVCMYMYVCMYHEDCKDGWFQNLNKCFKYFGTALQTDAYNKASQLCQSHDSQLATIHSREENDLAAGLIGKNSEVLIGWKDGKFVDGTTLFKSWSPAWYENKGSCTRLIGASHHLKPKWACAPDLLTHPVTHSSIHPPTVWRKY